jgi:chorismate-pyruvate lyase
MIKLSKETLNNNDIHFTHKNMSTMQRILLSSDGTMTNLLEELLSEELRANKIFEEIAASKFFIPQLEIVEGQQLWRRIITLQGKSSGIHFLHAESLIAPNNLDQEFADELINTDAPIGRIWDLFKVETYKSMMSWGVEPAGDIAKYFKIPPDQLLFYRTYRVFSQKRPVMQVTEKFPREWFQDNMSITNMTDR